MRLRLNCLAYLDKLIPLRDLDSKILLKVVFVIYIFSSLVGVFSHVLWRDEMQGWLVAVESSNIFELWANNAPSGHPIVYPFLTFISSLIYEKPISMQFMQWSLAAICVFIFLLRAPFSKLHKLLFAFGYFPFWEYCLISRHYVVIQLLSFSGILLVGKKKYNILGMSGIIALLLNTHALAWSIAIGFSVLIIIDLAIQKSNYGKLRSFRSNFNYIVSIIFVSISGWISLNSLFQTSRNIDGTSVNLTFKTILVALGKYLGGSILIIPNSSRWLDLLVASCISLAFIIFTTLYIRKSLKALVFYLTSTLSLLGFNSVIYSGAGSRHFGVYFIIFISSIWLYRSDMAATGGNFSIQVHPASATFENKLKLYFSYFLAFVLSIHFVAGIHRVSLDLVYPYSASKEVAKFITNSKYSDWPLFGTRDVEVTSVSGYLGSSIYYPELKRTGTFTEWINRDSSLRREDSLIHILGYMKNNKNVDSLLVILSNSSDLGDDFHSEDLRLSEGLTISFIKQFLRSYNKPERYYLYKVRRI